MSREHELVADPMNKILVDLNILHFSDVGIRVEVSPGGTYGEIFPIWN